MKASAEGFWETRYSKIQSIRNFSHLTILLAAVLCWNATNILAGVSTAKAPSFPFVAAELAQALVPFLMGITSSRCLFCCAMFLENLVRRRNAYARSESGRLTLYSDSIRVWSVTEKSGERDCLHPFRLPELLTVPRTGVAQCPMLLGRHNPGPDGGSRCRWRTGSCRCPGLPIARRPCRPR